VALAPVASVPRPPAPVLFSEGGSLTFGSGLVIVPFLEQGLVREYAWLDQRSFSLRSHRHDQSRPSLITATFVGYLVAGFWGSVVSTIGIFLAVIHIGSDRRAYSWPGIAPTLQSKAS